MPRRSSQTATNVAAWRAPHLLRDPDPKVFEDTHARAFAGFDSDEAMVAWVESEPRIANRGTPLSFALRHRFTEDQLVKAVTEGASQYVILGAGRDPFAHRRADLVGRLQVYEVDHPRSQQEKRDRIEQLGLPHPGHLRYAPVDFERQTLTDGLVAAGFDRNRPTFYSCLGVTQYLTRAADFQLFEQVATLAKRNVLAVEFIAPSETLRETDAAVVESSMDGNAKVGEPWLSFFTYEGMEAALVQVGFTSFERFGKSEAR